MKKPLPICLTVLFSFFCFVYEGSAQLHIYYNLFNDDTRYERDGKEISNPRVKKGEPIELHIEEFNDYIFSAKIEQTESSDRATGTGSISFNSLSKIPGFSGKIPGKGSGLNLPELGLEIFDKLSGHIAMKDGLMKETSDSRGSAGALISQINSNMDRLMNINSEMQSSVVEIKKLNRALEVVNISDKKIDALKFNPKLKPSTVKELSLEYSNAIFQKDDSDYISLEDILEWKRIPQKAGRIKADLSAQNESYRSIIDETFQSLDQLVNFAFDSEEIMNIYRQADSNLSRAVETSKTVENYISQLNISQEQTSVNDLFDLRVKIAEIKSNQFTFHHSTSSRKDELRLNATISYNDSIQNLTKEKKILKTKSFTIPTYGGINVDASVGIAFGKFFNKSLSYFKDDSTSVITAMELDDFVPIVSSFVHFYPTTIGYVSLGGSFGVGFPLSGGEDIQSVFFFLGPTLILGKSERAVLSGGLMGGRNKILTKGYQVGDIIEGPGDIPTSSRYELGAFLGISFNLTSN